MVHESRGIRHNLYNTEKQSTNRNAGDQVPGCSAIGYFTFSASRYEPASQYSSFLSNEELEISGDVTTAMAGPRSVAELKTKEQLRTTAVPPSLRAPPIPGGAKYFGEEGRCMSRHAREASDEKA